MTNDSNSTSKPVHKSKSRIRRPAKARLQSLHWVMSKEVEQYVEREEKDEKFRQAEEAAWTNYQATPLYITVEGVDTAAEADKWLEKLIASKVVPIV